MLRKKAKPPKYPCFHSESKRDDYLYKLVANGYQVERRTINRRGYPSTFVPGGVERKYIADAVPSRPFKVCFSKLYTVGDIDKRIGKARDT